MWMYNNPYFLPALRIFIEPITFLFLTLGDEHDDDDDDDDVNDDNDDDR